VPYALSHSRFQREHVNNALFYAVSCDMLGREGVAGIFFTLQSLDAPESVDEFKFRMGLMAEPVRQQVVFHPCLRPLATRKTHALLLQRLGRDPSNPLLAKAEGMLRFYLKGKRPLEVQDWPACLAEYRAQRTAVPASTQEQAARQPQARTYESANARASLAGGVRDEAA
jgi:hypothetical protein